MSYFVIGQHGGTKFSVSGPFRRRATAEQAAIALMEHAIEAEIISAAQAQQRLAAASHYLEIVLKPRLEIHPLRVGEARAALTAAETREAKQALVAAGGAR